MDQSITKVCKLCGKRYVYCASLKYPDGAYHWQDVACCPEHGGAFLDKLIAAGCYPELAKQRAKPEEKAVAETATKAENDPEELTDLDLDDEDFDEEEDDEDLDEDEE